MRYGVIMAGGSGTRLWPLSRADRPKQILPVVNGKSLLQLSYDRLRSLLPTQQIYVCTASAHAKAVRENLPELPAENLLGEPMGRDSPNSAFDVIADRPQSLVTFGILPTYGHTGLGYIHRGEPLAVNGAFQVL